MITLSDFWSLGPAFLQAFKASKNYEWD